ncbi:MAG: type II toxin-antitoxin system RelE/ParE family toxin [Planctomycetes bacterium]|nr:type II toxin-antitoxin system RelE/ParE family toxin [Planctomycetota bacterium]
MPIEKYLAPSGRVPFSEWVERLDEVVQAKVYAYIIRVADGGAKKNVKPLGEGVFEIKIDGGPGYRVYFGLVGRNRMILLGGGDKRSQRRDIETSLRSWRDYRAKNQEL